MIKFFSLFICIAFAVIADAQLNDVSRQELFSVNILNNAGFENGKAKWTASGGTFSTATSGSNLLSGKVSATWDSSSASQTLTSTAVAIPKGLYARNGLAQCKIQTPSGSATHTLQVYDGSSILASSTIVSSATPAVTQANFVYPSSGNIQIRIVSVASDEPLIAIDDCWLGDAVNISSVSQASLVLSGYFDTTTNCAAWARTNTALGSFATDADCPAPTVELNPGPGTLSSTDYDLPKFGVNNLPPGIYKVTFTVFFVPGGGFSVFAINDGTTTAGYGGSPTGAGSYGKPAIVTGTFSYTSAGNRTFELYTANNSSSVTVDISANLRKVYFTVERYPSSADQVLTPATSALSWSGYHDSTCSFARTNTSYGDPATDASCALVERTNTNFGTVSGSNNLPSITFTPSKLGKYKVCATVSALGASTGSDLAIRLWDGTTTVAEVNFDAPDGGYTTSAPICGIYSVASLTAKTLSLQTKSSTGAITIVALTGAAAVEWSIFAIDQQLPAPLLVNSVVSTSSGVTVVNYARITWSAGTPSVATESGDWVGALVDNAVGNVTMNINSGVFSARPACTCTAANSSTALCSIDTATTPSATAIRFAAYDAAGSSGDPTGGLDIICAGAK